MFWQKIQNFYFKILFKIVGPHRVAELMRSKFYYLGRNVQLYSCSIPEPYLVSIHDNVICAVNVRFITHDVSCFNIAQYLGISLSEVDKVGSIELFENCFVGAYSILLPNTSVGANSIVAAGSIVTRDIPAGEVWGGVPAKFIMTTDEYAKKVIKNCHNYPWMSKRCNNRDLIKMRQQYFFSKNKV